MTEYTQGEVVGGVYMSSAWDGELLYFPGGMRYGIRHKLRAVPRLWQLYLSFERYGTRDADGANGADDKEPGRVAPAAGNQAEVSCVDDEMLIVVNGTCSDYWLLVVASAGGEETASSETPSRSRCEDYLNPDLSP